MPVPKPFPLHRESLAVPERRNGSSTARPGFSAPCCIGPEDVWLRPGLALHGLVERWRKAMSEAFPSWSLTSEQFFLLDAVAGLEEEGERVISQAVLARRLHLSEVTISRQAKRLERALLLARGPCGTDSRVWALNLTESGGEIVKVGRAEMKAVDAAFFGHHAPIAVRLCKLLEPKAPPKP